MMTSRLFARTFFRSLRTRPAFAGPKPQLTPTRRLSSDKKYKVISSKKLAENDAKAAADVKLSQDLTADDHAKNQSFEKVPLGRLDQKDRQL
jgi:hypothetical protein